MTILPFRSKYRPGGAERSAFAAMAVRAFPHEIRPVAEAAANYLRPRIDPRFRIRTWPAMCGSEALAIPDRVHFLGLHKSDPVFLSQSNPAMLCLLSRSTDGRLRQAALRNLLLHDEFWSLPFVVLLSGEYVAEISQDLVEALPRLDRSSYAEFVVRNRPLMRRLSGKAKLYWDRFYRDVYPDATLFPGLIFLRELEKWAA